MIAEIRVRYGVHSLLLGLVMLSSVFCFWYPWYAHSQLLNFAIISTALVPMLHSFPPILPNMSLCNRFYVVRVREGVTYTSLWKIESITTVEMARDRVISQNTVRHLPLVLIL